MPKRRAKVLAPTNGVAFVREHAPHLARLVPRRSGGGNGNVTLRAMRALLEAQAGRDMSPLALVARHGVSLATAKRLRGYLRDLGIIKLQRRARNVER